jgi:uncharacterized membrane protein (UPF0127 family)
MSMRKWSPSSWLIAGLIVAVIAAGLYVVMPQMRPQAMVHLGDGIFRARIARTYEQRQTGLSGVQYLGDDEAMLFVFDRDSRWSIWMKDMNFPIDVVWLDAHQKVNYIVKNASPDSYPTTVFTPKEEARFVIEVKAGTVDQQRIAIGQTAAFDLNQIRGGER